MKIIDSIKVNGRCGAVSFLKISKNESLNSDHVVRAEWITEETMDPAHLGSGKEKWDLRQILRLHLTTGEPIKLEGKVAEEMWALLVGPDDFAV